MDLTDAIFGLIKKASIELPPDVRGALEEAHEGESGTAKEILAEILENVRIAEEKGRPMCQDTGALNFFVRLGDYSKKEIKEAIIEATNKATEEALLRPNSVDPITSKHSGNVPEIYFEEGEFEIKLLLKGGGSENVCAQYDLPNRTLNAGRDMEGAEKCVVDAVFNAQGKGCSPYFVGICIGGQRDTGYLEAKKQLFRKVGDRELADFELSVMENLNKLGIGPMGFSGNTTALEVFASTLPRQPASYFVTISLDCWALRRWTLTIKDGNADYS